MPFVRFEPTRPPRTAFEWRERTTVPQSPSERFDTRSWARVPTPDLPRGGSIESNIALIHSLRHSAGVGFGHAAAFSYWFGAVQSRGEWDYKTHGYPRFEDGGNFNYGATGRALGIPREMLLWAAGVKNAYDRWRAGLNPFLFGSPASGPPYGDDWHDQDLITLGMDYFDSGAYQRDLDFTSTSTVEGGPLGVFENSFSDALAIGFGTGRASVLSKLKTGAAQREAQKALADQKKETAARERELERSRTEERRAAEIARHEARDRARDRDPDVPRARIEPKSTAGPKTPDDPLFEMPPPIHLEAGGDEDGPPIIVIP